MRRPLLAAIAALPLVAGDLPVGKIIDEVKCAADPSQSYALYLPSHYSSAKTWPVILAFSPMAKGRTPVERFEQAAEKYGYIVAASNNSRNGDQPAIQAAIRAMPTDVTARFSVDLKRVYTAGFSGGARVAMYVALSSGKIAGVIACSAGFPDAQARKSAPFPIFGTAGTEDFNFTEMRRLDRALTTPHRVLIFEGTHDWLPAALATDAIEWLEIQGMKSGLRTRDEALVDRIFAARVARAASDPGELKGLVADFDGLRDVRSFAVQAGEWDRQKEAKSAIKKERSMEEREERVSGELAALESGLSNQAQRDASLRELRVRLGEIARTAQEKEDSPERRLARRLLRGTFVRSFEQVKDPQYQAMLKEFRAVVF